MSLFKMFLSVIPNLVRDLVAPRRSFALIADPDLRQDDKHFKNMIVLCGLCLVLWPLTALSEPVKTRSYESYYRDSLDLDKVRQERLIDAKKLDIWLKEGNTVVLDIRGIGDYVRGHIEGAVNLSVADITEESLAKAIPNKDTRVVIYCDNSFIDTRAVSATYLAFPLIYQFGYHRLYELNRR